MFRACKFKGQTYKKTRTLHFFGQLTWAPSRKDYVTGIVLEIFLGAVIVTGDLSDFGTVVSGELGLWES